MSTVGIICEYNPLHLGHAKQLRAIRELQGEDCGIVCLMSGNFVQRGAPAMIDKSLRAKAAILCGADLVLELPVTYALSSAEGFADGGVGILSGFCQKLCFGAEDADPSRLLANAQHLLSDRFSDALRQRLTFGASFPAARQQALADMGGDGALLTQPNNILAVEYCKAILRRGTAMEPLPIQRLGDYHDQAPDLDNPSATAVRALMLEGASYQRYIPEAAHRCFQGAAIHTLHAGQRAILSQLRRMNEEDFAALPYGSEGLWRKLMHAVRQEASVESILAATKSKRYTRTRLDRMLMCAFLGLTEQDLLSPAPYTRVLALNQRGRQILKQARQSGIFVNAGEAVDSPYWELEQRVGDLYGLFCVDAPEPPGAEVSRRIYVHQG